MAENIKFPIAKPNIEEVLEQFLEDKRKQLKPGTIRKYESIIDLFKHSLNSYAYQGLNESESKIFDQLYKAEGDAHKDFVQIFGLEKISPNTGEFLGYFMPRKVMCGKEMLKSSGTVIKKLGKWLVEHGYVTDESSSNMVEIGKEASLKLPAAEELADLLYEYANDHPVSDWTEEIDGYLEVEKVDSGKIYFSHPEDIQGDLIVLALPKEITDKCEAYWQINLFLGKTKKGWQIIEAGGVYPM